MIRLLGALILLLGLISSAVADLTQRELATVAFEPPPNQLAGCTTVRRKALLFIERDERR